MYEAALEFPVRSGARRFCESRIRIGDDSILDNNFQDFWELIIVGEVCYDSGLI